MTEKGEKVLVFGTVVFLVLALATMFYVRRSFGNEGMEEAEADASVESIQEEYFVAIEGKEADIIIPLPDMEDEETFRIEESLKDKTLEIFLQNAEEDYYYKYKVQGNERKISQVRYQQGNKESSLKFTLKDVYVTDVQVKDEAVYLTFKEPASQYERLVVLEGDCWEGAVTDRLEKQNIKGLVSGDIYTANELRTDFYLFMSVEAGAEKEHISIYYNDDYFIPEFDSKSLAEILEAEFAEQYGQQNVTVERTEEWELGEAMVPAVRVVCTMCAPDEGEPGETAIESFNQKNGMLIADALIKRYQEMEEKQ